MSSEIIVVLVMVVIAIAFVIWVRKNSQEHGPVVQDAEAEQPVAEYDTRVTKPDQAAVTPRSRKR
jgi:hypothetical protein